MSSVCFVNGFTGAPVSWAREQLVAPVSPRRETKYAVRMHAWSKKGFFAKLKQSVLRPLVSVPGSGGSGKLLECVFCTGTGKCDCDACKGTGKDALGTCLMCDGRTVLTCTVCNGIGAVDRIRRGGTDDGNQYFKKNMKKLD